MLWDLVDENEKKKLDFKIAQDGEFWYVKLIQTLTN